MQVAVGPGVPGQGERSVGGVEGQHGGQHEHPGVVGTVVHNWQPPSCAGFVDPGAPEDLRIYSVTVVADEAAETTP